jgi:hypothetical protein
MKSSAPDMIAQRVFQRDDLQSHCAAMARARPVLEAERLPPISIDVAKEMVIEALTAFSPEAGARAADILYDDERLDIHSVPAGQMKTMYCAPAGFENNERAIIHLDYDETVKGVILLAHELGHAIADDYGVDEGRSLLDNPPHMWEVQAYMAQHIVANALVASDNPNISNAAQLQLAQGYEAMNMLAGLSDLADTALTAGENLEAAQVMSDHFGVNWYEEMQQSENLHCRSILKRSFEDLSILQDGAAHSQYQDALKNFQEYQNNIFDRPAAFYAGAALAQTGIEHRADAFETVMGKGGYEDLQTCLDVADIKGADIYTKPHSTQNIAYANLKASI